MHVSHMLAQVETVASALAADDEGEKEGFVVRGPLWDWDFLQQIPCAICHPSLCISEGPWRPLIKLHRTFTRSYLQILIYAPGASISFVVV